MAMLPARALPLGLLAALAAAAPAAARPFTVSTAGNSPSVAVDAAGTAHVAWDTLGADETSTTHYCRVARNGAKCLNGTERSFTPAAGDRDFGGPRVFLPGGRKVLIATSRCCTSEQGPDGQFHGTRVYAIASSDGGASFGAPAWIGTQEPGYGAAFGRLGFLSFGTAGGGAGVQASPLAGFSGTENVVTPKLVISGGIGVSPRGNVVAFADSGQNVFAGALNGDPNTASIAFKSLGKGDDVTVTGGPQGVDVFYKTTGKQARYITRRYKGGKAGKISAVSEAGFPIFGTAGQDAAGRVHAVWQGDLGLTYRKSATSGRGFGKSKRLSGKLGFFSLAVAANAQGRATVVYDSNKPAGRVGGFTAG